MWNTMMSRDKEAVEQRVAEFNAEKGKVDRWGRIQSTLMGGEFREVTLSGRPLYQAIPRVHSFDPLFDGGIPADVRAARAAKGER